MPVTSPKKRAVFRFLKKSRDITRKYKRKAYNMETKLASSNLPKINAYSNMLKSATFLMSGKPFNLE